MTDTSSLPRKIHSVHFHCLLIEVKRVTFGVKVIPVVHGKSTLFIYLFIQPPLGKGAVSAGCGLLRRCPRAYYGSNEFSFTLRRLSNCSSPEAGGKHNGFVAVFDPVASSQLPNPSPFSLLFSEE